VGGKEGQKGAQKMKKREEHSQERITEGEGQRLL